MLLYATGHRYKLITMFIHLIQYAEYNIDRSSFLVATITADSVPITIMFPDNKLTLV